MTTPDATITHFSPSSGLPIGSPVPLDGMKRSKRQPAAASSSSSSPYPLTAPPLSSSPPRDRSPAAVLAAGGVLIASSPPSSSLSSPPSSSSLASAASSSASPSSSSSSASPAPSFVDNRASFIIHSDYRRSKDSSLLFANHPHRLSIEILSSPVTDASSSFNTQVVGTGKLVHLNVGGRRFTTTTGTLLGRGANFFSGLLSGKWDTTVDEQGAYFLDRNGDYFAPILEYLRTGKFRCSPDLSIEGLLEEAHYFSIDLLIDALSTVARPIPRITFEDVAGYSQIKAELKSVIDEVRDSLTPDSIYSKLFVRPAKCLLFYGPIGCGKSQLAAAFANYCRAELVQLDPQDPNFVARLDSVTSAYDWTVVFFREFDAILSHHTLAKTVVSFVDRVQDNPHVFVIARSSRPAGLWESPLMAPGRIDQRIYVPLPDEAGRLEILNLLLQSVPLESPDVRLRTAAATHGYSPADLKRLCQVMCRIALREYLDGLGPDSRLSPTAEILVDERHMKRALQVVRRSEFDRDIRTLPPLERN